jgi:hypothetical protein
MANDTPRYRADHSFVVQFQEQAVAGDARSGRIEHLTSGRGLRFHSNEQLLEFVAEVLSCLGPASGPMDGPESNQS